MPYTLLAIAAGASLGAIFRWLLGNALNALYPTLPPGTLAANLIGGYVIGLAIAWLGGHPALPPYWRLFIITGFCGGLTTFSTFSGELATLLQQARYGWMAISIAIHVGGSLAMTLLGIATVAATRAAH
ncbi:fluoride efflux transporter CrcB [Castellaniella sp.]|uniref:fluoride efflux transporter CrcB n=1 Tax=Castellaniella sp. TaxID=1955812 RepID=UPI002AFF9875|nr:fluoride efflux transporter CrcB [Castellaniella sp.]